MPVSGKLKSQMEASIEAVNAKMETIAEAIGYLDGIANAESDSTLAIRSVKLMAGDLRYVAGSLQLAFQNDVIHYRRLWESVGEEDLVGSRIISGQREALKEEARCRRSADRYRNIPYEESWIGSDGREHRSTGYRTEWGMVNRYLDLADNARAIYEEWVKKEEKYDEIEASTCHIFDGGPEAHMKLSAAFRDIDSCITEGGYIPVNCTQENGHLYFWGTLSGGQ